MKNKIDPWNRYIFLQSKSGNFKRRKTKPTPVGFEPTRAEPTGLAGRRLNHSAKVSRWLLFCLMIRNSHQNDS